MKTKNNGSTMKKVLRYIGKYWFFLLCSIVCAALTVTFTLYIPILTGDAVDAIIGPGQVDFTVLLEILKKMGIAILLTALTQWIMSVCNNRIAYHVVQDIRKDAFDKIQILPLKYLDAHPYGEIVSRVIADVDQFSDGLILGFTQLFTGVLTIFGTLIFMFRQNVGITLVIICITPVSMLVANFIAKKTYRMFKLQSETRGEQTALIDEMIGNQKVVQAFSYEEEAMKRFDVINEKLSRYSLQAIFFSSTTNPATRFVNSLVYTGVCIVGALSVISGRITVGVLSCFLSYANQYTKPFNEISGVFTEFQNALACAARIFELIEETPQVEEPADARVLTHADRRVAIVGPTGCGKTTIINLLMRFYDVDAGSIAVDDTDIRKLTRKSLRENYGMVLQETWLKAGTVRENLIMGKPDATDEEMIAAARAAHSHSFIKRLPNGYDTVLSEDGEGLSQGQKQLLCITRVMLCLPPMLILDEATSSIDTRTEIRIQKAFAKMMKGRTSFIIAHRLSTIVDADIILVMRDGHIIEQGRHEELLEKKGFYAELYNSQFVLSEN